MAGAGKVVKVGDRQHAGNRSRLRLSTHPPGQGLHQQVAADLAKALQRVFEQLELPVGHREPDGPRGRLHQEKFGMVGGGGADGIRGSGGARRGDQICQNAEGAFAQLCMGHALSLQCHSTAGRQGASCSAFGGAPEPAPQGGRRSKLRVEVWNLVRGVVDPLF